MSNIFTEEVGEDLLSKMVNPISKDVDSEVEVEDVIKLVLFKASSGKVVMIKRKFPHCKGCTNDGLIEIDIDGEIYYGQNESKLKATQGNRITALCQSFVYYTMYPKEIQDKIMFIMISTKEGCEIIFIPEAKTVIEEITEICKREYITPHEAYKDMDILSALALNEDYLNNSIAFKWKDYSDLCVPFNMIIDRILKYKENGNNT